MASGRRSFQSANPDQAAQWFKQATELSPDRVEGWINLGSVLIEATRYDAAAVALQRAVNTKSSLRKGHWRITFISRMPSQACLITMTRRH